MILLFMTAIIVVSGLCGLVCYNSEKDCGNRAEKRGYRILKIMNITVMYVTMGIFPVAAML